MTKPIRRKLISLISLVALIAGLTTFGVISASTASAAGTSTVSLNKTSGIVANEELTVTIVNTKVDPTTGTMIGVTICGNAKRDGSSITGNVSDQANANNCKGSGNAIGTVLPLKTNGLNAIADDGSGGTITGAGAVGGNGVSAKTYTVRINVAVDNLGLNEAKCLPLSATITKKCTVAVNPANAQGQMDGSADGYPVHTEFELKQSASIAVDSTTGSGTGTSAVRPGGTLVLSGANWSTASTNLTVSSCDEQKANCNTTGLSGTITTAASGGGLLSTAKTLTVGSGATTGVRYFKFTDSSETAYVKVRVLGTRAVTLSTTTVGPGTIVTVTGSDFDAGAFVSVSALAGQTPVGTAATSTASAEGAFSTTVTISDPTTTSIAATEMDLTNPAAPAPKVATATLGTVTFSANSCTGTNCQISQIITVTVNPGVISISQNSNAVTLTAVTLDGTEKTSTGNLNQVTVNDARGTLAGWSVTATMTNFSKSGGSASNATIPASKLTTTPSCAAVGDALIAEVSTGPASAMSTSSGIPMCTAANGGGGGTFRVDGALTLKIPASVRAGEYSATYTFLLS